MKASKAENLIWIIFGSIGIVFVIVGIVLFSYIFNYENKIETKGVITNISSYKKSNGERANDVYVSYYVDGKKYESKLNGYSSSFKEGKEIDIYYDKDNPNEIGSKSINLVFLVFPAIGIIFIIISGIGIYFKIKNKNLEKKLKENGTVIYANYIETIVNTGYSVNGRNPYNIICEWNNPEDNKKYILKSKNIWVNPEFLITQKNIKTLPVYINMKNKNQYVIDINSLTENVVDLS